MKILSTFSHSYVVPKPVHTPLFYRTQKKIIWSMSVIKQFLFPLTSIVWTKNTVFFKISSFVQKKEMHTGYNMRVSKWWQSLWLSRNQFLGVITLVNMQSSMVGIMEKWFTLNNCVYSLNWWMHVFCGYQPSGTLSLGLLM